MGGFGFRVVGLQRSIRVGSSRSQSKPQVVQGGRRSTAPNLSSCSRTLAEVIESTVVPRLVEDHETPAVNRQALLRHIPVFTESLLAEHSVPATAYFDDLIADGFPLHALFEHLLVPAARNLGELWESDALDFLDVTRAMDHIHQIILAHSTAFCTDGRAAAAQNRILLVAVPQERHRLGLCLVRAEFWREGWDVCCGDLQDYDDLIALVRRDHYDAVGLSAGRVTDPAALQGSIARARKVSRNRSLRVIAGGHAFSTDPQLCAAIGADATASNGRDAVTLLRTMLHKTSAG